MSGAPARLYTIFHISIKIRATQIESADGTAQLAPVLPQFRRTVRTKALGIPGLRSPVSLAPISFTQFDSFLFIRATYRHEPASNKWKSGSSSRLAPKTAKSLGRWDFSIHILFTNLCCIHRPFCARMPVHRERLPYGHGPLLAFPQEVVDVSALFQFLGGLSSVLER